MDRDALVGALHTEARSAGSLQDFDEHKLFAEFSCDHCR